MSAFHSPAGDPSSPTPRQLPERPSLEQLRKQAKDLLRAAREGDAGATARLGRVSLAQAQLAIAREFGFASWPRLVHHVESVSGGGFVLRPLIRPVELSAGRRFQTAAGLDLSADDVYEMFVAARDGDLSAVKRLVGRIPALATVEYNYTPPIHFAVREGQLAITELLLENGADPAYRSYPFSEPLLTFADDRGHAGIVELLRRNLTRRFSVTPGTKAIIDAAGQGHLRAVEKELARDPSLARAGNETGDTALHHAARSGHLDIVRTLIAAGADVDAERGDGYRPVLSALMPNWFFEGDGRHNEIAALLLSRGARYTIFIAALRGDTDFVRDAIARDRTLANFEDTCHHRVLSAAVRRGDAKTTRLLLDHGADPNLPEEGAPRGLSLWIAVNDGETEIVQMLLAHGADPNGHVDSSGTPMSQAVHRRRSEIAELLRRHGGREERNADRERVEVLMKSGNLDEAERLLRASPHLINFDKAEWDEGVLSGPAHGGRHDLIAMFMRLGARVPKVSKWAPYYYFKHEATAAFLLQNGMDPDHMNWHRFTLLHHMAAEGEMAKAKLLLDNGATIDAIDDEYRSTPLGVAARRGQSAMVELLLDRGADPTASGAAWAAPLAWAEKKGYAIVADRLRSATAKA